jgi:uncharacterized membrane protein YqhA
MGHFFESLLIRSRYFVILPVIFSLIGAIVMFVVASVDILKVIYVAYSYYSGSSEYDVHADAVALIIGAIDLYLIAVVMLIFSFGLYELFISRIKALDEMEGDSAILKIQTLDQLKDKLAKVIIMVLVVSFFQRVLHMSFSTPLEMLYFAGSILLLALGLYFLNKGGKS